MGHRGNQDLLALAGLTRTCILCSEKDPSQCHRQHLIARYLLEKHPEVAIWHILADNTLVNAASIHDVDDFPDNCQLSFKV